MKKALIIYKTAYCKETPNPTTSRLEGFERSVYYGAEFVTFPHQIKESFWRLFPDSEDAGYYETCSKREFAKYFTANEAKKESIMYTHKEIESFLSAANSDLGNPRYKPTDLIADYSKAVIVGQQMQAELLRLEKAIDEAYEADEPECYSLIEALHRTLQN